jgi:hypothetical protein
MYNIFQQQQNRSLGNPQVTKKSLISTGHSQFSFKFL